MGLSEKAKDVLKQAMANDPEQEEILAELEKLATIAAITPLGTPEGLVGVDGSGSNAAPLVETEIRLDNIEAKIDELIAAAG